MAIIYKGVRATNVHYKVDNDRVFYKDVLVFVHSGSEMILPTATLKTDFSMAPPPYDENGYNYSVAAPLKVADLSIPLGDVKNYSAISFDWDNEGSYNSYGTIKGEATIGSDKKQLFTGLGWNGTAKFDVSNDTGERNLNIHLEAKSNSPYKGYASLAAINITNLQGILGSSPEPSQPDKFRDDFSVDTGLVRNTVDNPIVRTTMNLGDVTSKSKLTFHWTNDGTNLANGTVKASYNFQNNETFFFDVTGFEMGHREGNVTIDLTDVTGNQNVIFVVSAGGLWSQSKINISDIYLI